MTRNFYTYGLQKIPEVNISGSHAALCNRVWPWASNAAIIKFSVPPTALARSKYISAPTNAFGASALDTIVHHFNLRTHGLQTF